MKIKKRKFFLICGIGIFLFIGGNICDYYLSMKSAVAIQFVNRETKEIQTEDIFGEGALRWVYETHLGKIALYALIRRSFFSEIYGGIKSRPSSVADIKPFIEKYHMNADEFKASIDSFTSFNDFFSRELKPGARPVVPAENAAVLPADGRHLAFNKISATETYIYAKGQSFNLKKFFDSAELAERYDGGALICSRLCPTDYHRFHFPVAGTPKAPKLINGSLYSVNPIALSKNLEYLWENKRVMVEIDSPRFGKVLQVLVGATNVGTIVTTFSAGKPYEKGAELGYFRFGGSFVATFFEPNKVRLAPDLIENTVAGRETFAKMGTLLGEAE